MVKFFLWFSVYLATLLAEVFIFPVFFGSTVPALSLAVLFLGVASQDFSACFLFAGLAGVMRDIFSFQAAAWHTIFALSLFFAVHFFIAIVQLEEPLRRIGAIAAGFVLMPVVWFLSSAAGRLFFGVDLPYLAWRDLESRVAIREIIFAFLWFSVFSWLAIKFWSKQRDRLLRHI